MNFRRRARVGIRRPVSTSSKRSPFGCSRSGLSVRSCAVPKIGVKSSGSRLGETLPPRNMTPDQGVMYPAHAARRQHQRNLRVDPTRPRDQTCHCTVKGKPS